MTTCDKCGAELKIRDFPFCPHGSGAQSVVGDDVPGGFTVENGFDSPQTFYSKKAHRDALAARGMEIAAKWAGPNDKHLSRMDAPCATTLENARILLTRGRRAAEPAYEPVPITVTDIHFKAPQ